jgi:hypothetical protein
MATAADDTVKRAEGQAAVLDKLAHNDRLTKEDLDKLPDSPAKRKFMEEDAGGVFRGTSKESKRNLIVDTLKVLPKEDASQIIQAMDRDSVSPDGGAKFYDFLIKDPAKGATSTPSADELPGLKAILHNLSPHAAASFLVGVTDATDKEVKNKNLLGALVEGVKVSGEVGIEGGDDKKGKASAKLGGELALDKFAQALESNTNNAYLNQLKELTKDFRRDRYVEGGRPWTPEEDDEFRRTITSVRESLPGQPAPAKAGGEG